MSYVLISMFSFRAKYDLHFFLFGLVLLVAICFRFLLNYAIEMKELHRWSRLGFFFARWIPFVYWLQPVAIGYCDLGERERLFHRWWPVCSYFCNYLGLLYRLKSGVLSDSVCKYSEGTMIPSNNLILLEKYTDDWHPIDVDIGKLCN